MNEEKLRQLLNFKLTSSEAMILGVTRRYALIMNLIRYHTNASNRSLLNLLTEEIRRYEDMLLKNLLNSS